MKRVGHLYPAICDIENIKEAILMASLGKRDKNARVREIIGNVDFYAKKIHKLLVDQSYVPSPYAIKTIYDGTAKKERTIYKPRFYPDQIIHWALMLVIQPILMRGMYAYTCGSVPGRGSSYAQRYLRNCLDQDYAGTKYCLKMDISKFYPSIDQNVLKDMFRRVIKDRDCLRLIDTIIESAEQGLPIGNYTSQWFANYFLQELDHYIKSSLQVKYYIRYVDDMVLLGPNKKVLHRVKRTLDDFLAKCNLKIKKNWQVFLINKRFIDFLGFRFYRNHTTLRGTNALRIRRRVAKIFRKPRLNAADAGALISYWGWIKRSDSYRFYAKYFSSKLSLIKAKDVVRYHAKLRKNS